MSGDARREALYEVLMQHGAVEEAHPEAVRYAGLVCACGIVVEGYNMEQAEGAMRSHVADELARALLAEEARPHAFQRCPVCDGHGYLNYMLGVAHGQPTFVSSSTGPWPCHRCNGIGTLEIGGAAVVRRDEGEEPSDG